MNPNLDADPYKRPQDIIDLEQTLRPAHLENFSGQTHILENLSVFIKAAKMRGEALDHTLFHGPPGLGKTTLANILAREMGVSIKITSGPVIDKPGDLAGLLTNLETHDILFIDEIHRMSPIVEEYLYSAMEDFKIDIMIESGPNAQSVEIKLNKFTLVGATTRSGLLTAPMRARFGINCRLTYYDRETLTGIVNRSASIMQVGIDIHAAREIAGRSRGTPRISNALLKRVRDFAQVEGDGYINISIAKHALEALKVDEYGLDEMDNKILSAIIDKYKGGPVGLNTLAMVVSENPETLEEVYEPYLVQEGFLIRTARGREATDLAYTHLNRVKPVKQDANGLFENSN